MKESASPNVTTLPFVQEDASAEPISGAEIIWKSLVDLGVETVFGYPGGAIMPAYDAMPKYPIRHVLVRHEQGATHMADGFARATGKVGVVIATSGPGATNLVTGIANAMLDSIPIVCITGQVASHLLGTDAFQETDVSGVTLPITKHNYLVTKSEDIAPAIFEAFELAMAGRQGPVLVDITKDAQINKVSYVPKRARTRDVKALAPAPKANHQVLKDVLAMLKAAQKPIILAGHGILKADATESLKKFVELTQIPVGATLLGLGGFPASHPLALGMLGMHGGAWANNAVQRADLVFALGMRFDDRVTGNTKTFAQHAKKVHVELDPSEINKIIQVDVPINADVGEVLDAWIDLIEAEPSLIQSDRKLWHETINRDRVEAKSRDILNTDMGERLLATHVIHDLWRTTNGDIILSTDVGQHQMWAAQYFAHEDPRTLITSGGLGTMGFALPAGIGAKFGQPNKQVWIMAGDGGFQMTAPELTTILQEKIKVNIAVINNGFLGMVRQWQEMFFDKRYVETPIVSPDFVKLAEAHGHEGIRVTRRSEVEPAILHAQQAPHTVLIEFQVEAEDMVYPMVPTGKSVDEMVRRPSQ